MSDLKNKIAVVTGGNSGIGFASAQQLIEDGAKVIITGRNKQAVEEAATQLGHGTVGIVADQASIADTDALVKKITDTYGKVDVLFINAGVASFAPLEYLSEDAYDSIMNVNLKGAIFTFQRFLPLLQEGASVIFLSSVNAYTGMANTLAYAASKAGLNSVMRTTATELAPKGIRVNSISPGPIQTPLFGKVGLPAEALQSFAENLIEKIPLKRFGESAEVAKLVSFLGSNDSGFITGTDFTIDGGFMLRG
jgi:NAD(P)-dependent dehydrogenase (short-subunit alcohol dehydrogenase family)